MVRHFIYAQAETGGVHIILAVAQYRNGRSLKVLQDPQEQGEAVGVLSRAVCDNSDGPVKLREKQEFGNEIGCIMDVKRRRQDGNQNTVGIVSQLRNLVSTEGGWRVDDDRFGLVRNAQRPGAIATYR